MKPRYADLDRLRAKLQAGGGPERLERQRRQGKLTARERLALLFDPDSFVEFGLWVKHRCPELAGKEFPADGVVTGKGVVDGRPVFAFSQDFTVTGGSLGEGHALKIVKMQDMALKMGVPVIGINELEYVDGLVYANVWPTDTIVMIDPADGIVKGRLDLSGLLSSQRIAGPVDVLNGIAWDAANRRLFVTGKWWPSLFQVRLLQS